MPDNYHLQTCTDGFVDDSWFIRPPAPGIYTGGPHTVYTHTTYTPPHYSEDYIPDFRCERCVHYEGGIKCTLNFFIYASGVDMSGCWGFEEGKVCRHCGRRT